MLNVEGPPQLAVYSGKITDEVYRPEGAAVQAVGAAPKPVEAKTKAEKLQFGERIFSSICTACHQPSGLGIPGVFPPLAGSDFLNADKQRALHILLNGLQGEVTVNGKKFNNVMPRLDLSDEDIANVLTFVYSSWGNSGKEVSPAEVAAARGK